MTFTNEQMLNNLIILSRLDEKGMLGYAISKNRRLFLNECKEYADKRDELLREFGTDMGNGEFQLVGDAREKFAEAIKPYSELECEVAVMKVSEDVFCSGNLTSQQMFALDWMVKEE